MSTTPWFRVSSVVLDAPDAHALARFYEQLLGWPVMHEQPGWVKLRGPNGEGMSFASEPLFQSPTWPSQPAAQQMMAHLDIEVNDLDEAGAYAVSLGATLADFQPQDDVRVYLDPVGHPFCIFVR